MKTQVALSVLVASSLSAIYLVHGAEVDAECGTASTAREIVEQYLGPDVPNFSLYNTTKDARDSVVTTLKDYMLTILSSVAEGSDFNLDMDVIIPYGLSMVGTVLPGILALLFSLFVAVPLIFVRLCCARKCCAPHHPLWGQENGTLKDFPHPKCCGGSRGSPAPSANGETKSPGDDRVVRPYTYWEQCSPVFFYILFAVFMFCVCVSGALAVGTIVSGIDGSVCSVDTLLQDARAWTDGLTGAMGDMLDTGVEKLNEVADIINSGVITLTSDASQLTDSGTWAVRGIDNLVASTQSSYAFDSSAITSALDALSDAATTLETTFNDIDSLIVGPRDVILGIAETLDGITNSTDGFFDEANAALHDTEVILPAIPFVSDGEPTYGYLSLTESLTTLAVGTAFFVLAILSIPFTVFGILVMGPKCAHKPHPNKSKTLLQCCGLLFSRLSCCGLYINILIACIPALLIFPVSFVLSDTCSILEDFGENHNTYLDVLLAGLDFGDSGSSSSSGTTASGSGGFEFDLDITTGVQVAVDTCFGGGNLLDALNITTTLVAYVDAVDFTALDDLDAASIVDMSAIQTQISDLTDSADIYTILSPFDATDRGYLTDACGSCTNMGNAAAALNKVPFYTGSDYSTQAGACVSCAAEPCLSIQSAVCQINAEIGSFETDLNAVKANFTVVQTDLAMLYGNILFLEGNLTNAADGIVAFAQSVFTLEAFSTCGFIKEFYDAFVTALCPGSVSGFLWLGYSMNLMCISAICTLVCITLINCRLGGVGQPNHHSDPKNFAPSRVGAFFNGSHDDGNGHDTAKVAPATAAGGDVEMARLDTQQDAEATRTLEQVKSEDSNSGAAGVAM